MASPFLSVGSLSPAGTGRSPVSPTKQCKEEAQAWLWEAHTSPLISLLPLCGPHTSPQASISWAWMQGPGVVRWSQCPT